MTHTGHAAPTGQSRCLLGQTDYFGGFALKILKVGICSTLVINIFLKLWFAKNSKREIDLGDLRAL